MLSSLLGSEIGLVVPWVGDGHMGNLARKDAYSGQFLEKFKEVVFYKKCKGDVENLKQYLEEWAKELGAALEVEDIFDEEELKNKEIIQTKLVTRAEYEQRLKDENNDVRRIRGNQYLQYSIENHIEKKSKNF